VGNINAPSQTFGSGEKLAHFWGQYSPYFDVPSTISSDLPSDCRYSSAQILSRHGSRYPTWFKSWSYKILIDRILADVNLFTGRYEFLANYTYELGADQLTPYGEGELFRSGQAFYGRYQSLTKEQLPFIRASGQDRVIKSAGKFIEGFHEANLADKTTIARAPTPSISVIISEEAGSNNTLSIHTCPAFLESPNIGIGPNAKAMWASIFTSPIQERLNRDLQGANLSPGEVIDIMDLCPFETVATSEPPTLSPFCDLFTQDEWRSYDYYQSLDKYYGHSMGNPLAPTLGVGFVNEVIARLTGKPVQDHTCTNSTLDSSNSTFPLDAKLYADFSHDNDMEAIFAALGLYNETTTLPLKSRRDAEHSDGFSATWTVPFGARIYVEKMRCGGVEQEYIRVLVNGRVAPLRYCGADELGRCALDDFVRSLSFARGGGLWNECFKG
jgi:Histidine phosphatase superfamily (branch 2)